jgi:hypothetical protein
VALIDTGVNPYHIAFRAPEGLGAETHASTFQAEIARITLGNDYEEALEMDKDIWAAMEPERLYAFAGTRVFGISMSQDSEGPAILDVIGHGTGTLSVAAREAPGAFLVMVQVDARGCTAQPDCPPFTPAAPAMAWIAEQPWINVVSVSLSYLGNPPHPSNVNPDAAPYVAASRKAHEDGKLMLAAAGNGIIPSLQAYYTGPPWVIPVGGAQPKPHGNALFASKGPELVANYTEWVAVPGSMSDMRWASGTSFATPLVAGILAAALAEVRAMGGGQEDSGAYRDALHAVARHFNATEWDPTQDPTNDTTASLSSTNLPVLLPEAQEGWGYIEGIMTGEIARRVLENDLEPPPEKAQTAQYMAQWQSLREQYWQNAP